jgi:hypothetical protein
MEARYKAAVFQAPGQLSDPKAAAQLLDLRAQSIVYAGLSGLDLPLIEGLLESDGGD